MKANPHPAVLRLLVEAGSAFDVASPAEVVACLDAGATADQLLYSNPIKRRTDLQAAYDLGVRLYVVDCLPELLKLAEVAPRRPGALPTAHVRFRRRTGRCRASSAAARTTAWTSSLPAARHWAWTSPAWRSTWDPSSATRRAGGRRSSPPGEIFDELQAEGIEPWLLDLGGGFPAAMWETSRASRVRRW